MILGVGCFIYLLIIFCCFFSSGFDLQALFLFRGQGGMSVTPECHPMS